MQPLTHERRMGRACLTVLSAITLAALPAAASARPAIAAKRACAEPSTPHTMACLALVRTDVTGRHGVQAQSAPVGLSPADLRKAYALPPAPAGAGQTVAIVDAYDDPNAESDLADLPLPVRPAAVHHAPTAASRRSTSAAGQGARRPTRAGPRRCRSTSTWSRRSARVPHPAGRGRRDQHGRPRRGGEHRRRLGAKYVSNSYGGSRGPEADHLGLLLLQPPRRRHHRRVRRQRLRRGVPRLLAVRHLRRRHHADRRRRRGRGWREAAWGGAGSGCSA